MAVIYKNHDDIISALTADIRTEDSFRKDAEDLDKQELDYEKRVFTAPLIGCGAGLILLASSIGSGKLTQEITALVVPSLWAFFLGVILSVLAGLCYFLHIVLSSDAKRKQGNAQQIVLDKYDAIRRLNPDTSSGQINYVPSASDLVLFDKAVDFHKTVPSLQTLARRCLITARVLVLISAFLFIIGVAIPLTLLSLQYNFIWE